MQACPAQSCIEALLITGFSGFLKPFESVTIYSYGYCLFNWLPVFRIKLRSFFLCHLGDIREINSSFLQFRDFFSG